MGDEPRRLGPFALRDVSTTRAESAKVQLERFRKARLTENPRVDPEPGEAQSGSESRAVHLEATATEAVEETTRRTPHSFAEAFESVRQGPHYKPPTAVLEAGGQESM